MSRNEPEIVEFGPYRVIGMRYAGKNEHGEIPALWHGEGGFVFRFSEIKTPPGADMSFGLCRCLPGVTDGSFEYIAALPAACDAPIPDGMVEAKIGKATYAVFTSPTLADIFQAWQDAMKWCEEQSEWQCYCDVADTGICECAEYPSFELYPADFGETNRLYVYIPIRPKR